jgi:hypothetical protein
MSGARYSVLTVSYPDIVGFLSFRGFFGSGWDKKGFRDFKGFLTILRDNNFYLSNNNTLII